jgi:hypothetical protein
MSEIQTVKKFEAKIPIAVWRKWEEWLDGRGSLNNTQIMVGLLRLFLAAPEELQLKAFFGREADLSVSPGEALTPWQCEEIRKLMATTKQADTDAVVDDATRNVQARRSTQDRPKHKSGG